MFIKKQRTYSAKIVPTYGDILYFVLCLDLVISFVREGYASTYAGNNVKCMALHS